MAAQLFYLPFAVAMKATGVGAPGAKAYFYAPGTTTLRTVYSNAGLTIARSNPVVADGAGAFPATYINDTLTYKLVITDRNGAVLYTRDPYIPGEVPDASVLSPYSDAAASSATAASASATAASASATAAAASATAAALSETNVEAVEAANAASIAALEQAIADNEDGTLVLPTALNVKNFGALGNGLADDTAEIQAAIDACGIVGANVLVLPTPTAGGFYKCDGQLDFSQTEGLKLLGDGARVEPTQDTVPCALVYTGTASAFILAGKSRGLTIDGLGIQVSNASFTGDIITLDHDGTVRVTYSTSIVNCMIGGRTAAARNARSCINATGAVELFVDLNTFGYADQQIISRADDSSRTYSNAVTITRNRFTKANNHAINIYSATQWTIANNVFEPRYDGTAGGISDLLIDYSPDSRNSFGIVIEGNGFWDAPTGTWLDFYGAGQTISGNWAGLYAAAVFVHFRAGVGAKLAGNRIEGTAGATFMTVSGSLTGLIDDGSNLVDGAVTYNGNTAATTYGGAMSVGYKTGTGGAVTQITSKSTGVTLDKANGAITMHNAALAAGAKVSFVVTNARVAATDVVVPSVKSGGTANAYRAAVTAVGAGSFTMTVENITGGSLSEAPVINFAVIKAVAA